MSFTMLNLIVAILILISLLSILLIIRAANPVYSVLFLLILFVLVALVLLLTTNEFLAFIYIIVYIGAVIVLLLWIVMTIPIKPNYDLSPGLLFTYLVFFSLFSIVIFFIMLTANSPTIEVFTVHKSDELFDTFWTLYRKHIPASVYTNFAKTMQIYSINDVTLPVSNNVHLSVAGEKLFIKLFSDIWTKHQVSNVYFPINLPRDSMLWVELFQIYSNMGVNLYFPRFINELVFTEKLTMLIVNNHITVNYFNFLLSQPTLVLIHLVLAQQDLASNLSALPMHIFSDIGGVTPKYINFDFKLVRFIDWINVFHIFSPNLVVNLAVALYISYGHVLLIIALILLVAMVGIISIISLPFNSLYNRFLSNPTNEHH